LQFEGFARDCLAVADAIGEPNLIGVGHSLGGAAFVLAERARPGTFTELFLYEPGLRPESLPSEDQVAYQKAMVDAMKRRRSRFPSCEAALAAYAGKPPMSAFQAATLAAYVEYGFAPAPDEADGIDLKCPPYVEAQIVANTFTHDAAAAASSLACPLTQVYGTLTAPVQEEAICTVARLTGTRAIPVDGLGHFGPMEQPWIIAKVIEQNLLSLAT
jgi:pimeloyl-ACP methyl ester carboxylesterase